MINKSSKVINTSEEQKFWEENDFGNFVTNIEENESLSNLKPSTKIITLRVPEHLLSNLKLIANKRDIPYQSLLKNFLQEKINEELQTPFLKLRRKAVRTTIVSTLGIMITFLITYNFLIQPIKAVGPSMTPSLPTNTYYWLDKLAYRLIKPQRGDVVVFNSPTQLGSQFVKRVIGLPGDKIKIVNNRIKVNDQLLNEDYITGETNSKMFPNDEMEIIVPGNSYYVLGDNRDESTDSRDFGFVSRENIIGRVGNCYWNCK
jgi:signal peptidase I